MLSGFGSQGAGEYERSIEEAERAIGLNPDLTPCYLNLAFSNLYLDRLRDAAVRALARKYTVKVEVANK